MPLADGILFLFVPINSPVPEGEGMSLKELVKSSSFRILFVMMLCAGACEMAVSQWASTLCENALGVSKTIGDLAGMAGFAVLMGTARALHGKFAEKVSLGNTMLVSALLCILAYLVIALVPNAAAGMPLLKYAVAFCMRKRREVCRKPDRQWFGNSGRKYGN